MDSGISKPPEEASDRAANRERLAQLVTKRGEFERNGFVHLSAN